MAWCPSCSSASRTITITTLHFGHVTDYTEMALQRVHLFFSTCADLADTFLQTPINHCTSHTFLAFHPPFYPVHSPVPSITCSATAGHDHAISSNASIVRVEHGYGYGVGSADPWQHCTALVPPLMCTGQYILLYYIVTSCIIVWVH